jgi:hypothetical protein
MIASLDHPIAKGVLVLDTTIVTVEVVPTEFRERLGDAPGAGEKKAAITRGQEGEDDVTDTGDRKLLGACTEFGSDD